MVACGILMFRWRCHPKEAIILVISYKKLWKLLIDKDMKKKDLQKLAGISSASITKLGKNENEKIAYHVRIDQEALVVSSVADLKNRRQSPRYGWYSKLPILIFSLPGIPYSARATHHRFAGQLRHSAWYFTCGHRRNPDQALDRGPQHRIYKQCCEDRLTPAQRSIDLIERKYLR